jgi:tetratricopeptide (TPR) repeat protein
MSFLPDVVGMLAFQSRSLRALAARQALVPAYSMLCFGFVSFVAVRDEVQAQLGEIVQRSSLLHSIFASNLIQTLLFLSVVYVPAVISLSNAFAGDGLGFSFSRDEYRAHIATLFPLWGLLLAIATPLQLTLPHFLVLGVIEISYGLIGLGLLGGIYTVWAIKELNYLSSVIGFGVFVLTWFTLPAFYVLTIFLFALPLLVLVPLLYLSFQRFWGFLFARVEASSFQERLRGLTLNPRDADAHYQLGLIHLKRNNLDAARRYFESALKIDSRDPDCHYYLGRVFESKGDWPGALEQYEETYRLEPNFHLGDIFRDVGKAYLNNGQSEKAEEFLRFFLERRNSDPEGRYWLALTYQKLSRDQEMRAQLNILLDQARANPRFFRKENRQWLYRSRILLRHTTQG